MDRGLQFVRSALLSEGSFQMHIVGQQNEYLILVYLCSLSIQKSRTFLPLCYALAILPVRLYGDYLSYLGDL